MKIQDIITLKKILVKSKVNNVYNYNYENQTQLNYAMKKGYYWEIPSHSQNESVLLNNYEKDCVIAYINNKYILAFLIKIRGTDNFRGFVYLKEFLKSISGSYTYTINDIYNLKDVLKVFQEDEKNLKIIENIEYKRFVKLVILEGLEEE